MDRFARCLAFGLVLAAAAALAGCNGGASKLLTGSTEASTGLKNDDPQARPIAVAWTSARAKRCGFYFDPAELRASYLAFEAKQSPPEQLAKAEKTYDATFNAIAKRVAANADYCTDTKSKAIKTHLTRHLAGDFTPDLPKPKESCGFLGCLDTVEEEWTPDKFWTEQERQLDR